VSFHNNNEAFLGQTRTPPLHRRGCVGKAEEKPYRYTRESEPRLFQPLGSASRLESSFLPCFLATPSPRPRWFTESATGETGKARVHALFVFDFALDWSDCIHIDNLTPREFGGATQLFLRRIRRVNPRDDGYARRVGHPPTSAEPSHTIRTVSTESGFEKCLDSSYLPVRCNLVVVGR